MKKFFSVASLLLALILLAMCCAACGDSDNTAIDLLGGNSGNGGGGNTLAGSYSGYDGNKAMNLTINSDNTGTLYDEDYTASCVFNPLTNAVDMTLNGQTVSGTYTFDGTNLSITANNYTITLSKTGGSSNSGNGGSVIPATSSLAGTYTGDDAGTAVYLTINSDNTGTLIEGSNTASCVFNTSGTVDLTFGGQTFTGTYTLSSSTLTLTVNGAPLTLTKSY